MTDTTRVILIDEQCVACVEGDHADHHRFYIDEAGAEMPCRCVCQLPPVAPDLPAAIASLTTEAKALLPAVADFAERAKLTREEYHAELDGLGVDDSEVTPWPGASWPGRDYVAERDGLNGLGDAVLALEQALGSIFDTF